MELKKLNWTVFLVSCFILGATLLCVLQDVFPYVRDWYWVERYKEPVNHHYQIQTKLIEIEHAFINNRVQATVLITDVDDGMGRQIGLQKDDLVFSDYHYLPMSESYFYKGLALGYFPYAKLIVVNKEEYLQCGKKWPDPSKFRELNIKTSGVPLAKEKTVLDRIFAY